MVAMIRDRWVLARAAAVAVLVVSAAPPLMGATDSDSVQVTGWVQPYILITAPQRANLFLLNGDSDAYKKIEVTVHVDCNASFDVTLSGTALVNDEVTALPEFVWTFDGAAGSGPRVGWWDANWRQNTSHVYTVPGDSNTNHSVDIEVHMDPGSVVAPGHYIGILTITPTLAD